MKNARTLIKKKSTESENGCWIWTAHKIKGGYGRCRYEGKRYLAHRLSWLAYMGAIPNGLDVCHRCDVPACVNPQHLFVGTHADNMSDAKRKGRFPRKHGELSSQSTLSDHDASLILKSTEYGASIARRFGVTKRVISSIRKRRTYKHLEVVCVQYQDGRSRKRELTEDQIAEMASAMVDR